jgi:hypothetical protein
MVNSNDENPRRLNDRELDERWKTVGRRHRILGAVGVVLALAIIGVIWYTYPALSRHDLALTQFASVQKVVDTLGGQMKAADAKIENWTSDQQDLRDQVSKLGHQMEVRMQAARKQAQETSAALLRRVQAQIDMQMLGMQNRLAHLESASDTEQTRIASMQHELIQVRSEMAKQAEELSAVRHEMDQSGASHEQRLASLSERQQRDRQDVDAISRKLAVQRVSFEITKNHSQELAPGISLGITGTDVLYRRATGWMWVMPDRRTIWLRRQGAQEPVIFYGVQDGKRRELVITNVAQNSVTGYLLLPKEGQAAMAAANQQPAGGE